MKTNPNRETTAEIENKKAIIPSVIKRDFKVQKEVYVPIYSDIYLKSKDYRTLLTATLSVRNTSSKDTLFLNNVDYYNTKGNLVRRYIESSIFLTPMETIDFVIDEEDDKGGSGANFVIKWSAKKELTPIFQGVMVGTSGQHGFAFTTNGTTISN